MLPKPVTYHNAVICRDQIFEEEQSLPPKSNMIKVERHEDGLSFMNEEENGTEAKWELIDNPFLRAPRPASSNKKVGTGHHN